MILFNLGEISHQIRLVCFDELRFLDDLPANKEDGENEDPVYMLVHHAAGIKEKRFTHTSDMRTRNWEHPRIPSRTRYTRPQTS